MDSLLFHPKVVHLPLALAVLMPLMTGGALISIWRGWLDRRVWVVVVLLQAMLVGSGALAMITGEREEERIEERVPERHIDAHEEAAELFVWGSAAVLALMAVPLALPEGRARRAVSTLAFMGTLVALGLGFEAGEAGGELVYVHGAAQVYVESSGSAPADDGEESD